MDFAHRGFVYGMGQGECLLGYFPEWLGVARPQTLEVCELAEMLALAVKLSAAGVGDYWDMADRWTRNLFFESQLHDRHVPFLEWRSRRTPTTETARTVLPPYHETDGAIRRNVGGFGGWLAPNDWLPDYPHHCQYRDPGVMHCCTGNGTRAIYYLWEHALRCEADHLRVHLLMNRVSEWADVHSHVPYEGRVDVDVKRPVSVSIRLPEWVQGEEVTCAVDDQPRRFEVEGRYALIGQVAAGATATLRFPIPQRDELIDVEKRTYRILLRGSTCVAIDPPGANVPLFRRDHYLDWLHALAHGRTIRGRPDRALVTALTGAPAATGSDSGCEAPPRASMSTRPVVEPLPDPGDGIGVECAIATDDGDVFDYRLGDEQTIEGVAMMQRQPCNLAGMTE